MKKFVQAVGSRIHGTVYPVSNVRARANPLIKEELETKITEIVRNSAKCEMSKITLSASFEQMGFDSLDSVDLVVKMEQDIGFDISNEEATSISSIESAIETFYGHLNRRASLIDEA